MGLSIYQQKRDFKKSPEPKGNQQKRDKLFFVVQKHAATVLHYDFRLEYKGVLLSWAVPKGISLDPSQKRLATQVEDHPVDYANFEGVIPEGNYGAGTVMVWDTGNYSYPNEKDPKKVEKLISEGLKKGHFSFVLEGKKLKGEFALAKLKNTENNWILFKKNDAEAKSVFQFDNRSVLSGRTMSEIKKDKDSFWMRDEELSRAPEAPMPHQVKPMMAYTANEAFDREGWIFEIKWDGYRAITEVGNGKVSIYSRNLKSFNERFPSLVQSFSKYENRAVFDGEIVVVDDEGKPNFEALQDYGRSQGYLVYFVFDLLYFNGRDLTGLPLVKRKDFLKRVLEEKYNIKFCDHIEKEGKNFFKIAEERGIEGIMAKDGESRYQPGVRSRSWMKIKGIKTTEAIIAGFTEPQGGRSYFGALILGVMEENGTLRYIGHVGSGFSDKSMANLMERMKPLISQKMPFSKKPQVNAPAKWLRPELVCEVKYAEWTKEGYLRQPVFLHLRDDIEPSEVSAEAEMVETTKDEGVELLENEKTEKIEIDGREIELSNLKKVYWPEEGYTKLDLINYYEKISNYILPYLKNRPESLNRFPDGIEGKHFYQKNVSELKLPEWMETIEVNGTEYLLCQKKYDLIYMANLGCIEINPWNSRINKLDYPDYFVIDLDPVEIEFEAVVEAALVVKKVLDEAGIESYPKTSGATGIHIFVPLGAKYSYEQAKQFGNIVAILASARLPKITSLERSPEKRKGRVYLDYLQNNRGQTLAAAYSVRPVSGAIVSTPLLWEEVNKNLSPKNYTIKNIFERIEKIKDPFLPLVKSKGIDLEKSLARLSKAISS